MEYSPEQIGQNVMEKLNDLQERKLKLEKQLEDQIKTKLIAINAEIRTLEILAGLRKKPGRQGANKEANKEDRKKEATNGKASLLKIAESILKSHEETPLTASKIAQLAIDTGLWENAPSSAKANMGRALKNIKDEETEIRKTDDNKYYILIDSDNEYIVFE